MGYLLSGKKIHITTLGCAKNEVDSAKMEDVLVDAGCCMSGGIEDADAIIVNTCSFIRSAAEESIDEILDAIDYVSSSGSNAKIIVTGCLPSRYGSDLADELPEVYEFLPCTSEVEIADVLERCFSDGMGKIGHASCPIFPEDGESAGSPASDASAGRKHPKTFAYVKISDGCDRWCSYCTIPKIRGRYRSFPYEDISRDVDAEIREGAKEVVLIAQDTSRWGQDLEGGHDLAYLIDRLAKGHPEAWFRVMYLQPEGVTDRLLEAMSANPNIAPYLDIPLQHVDSGILHAMNREGSLAEFKALVRRIRDRLPNAVLRTTLITGFPGETEEQFDELVDFAGEGEFDYVGIFPYSREEGTKAFHLHGQVDEGEKEHRAQTLRILCDSVGAHLVSARIGNVYPVLIEGIEEDGQRFGRSIIQAPEVDGFTYLDRGEIGEIVNVLIKDTFLYDMEGVAI